MKRVALYHLDGALPNLALMRISAHHNAMGDRSFLVRPKDPSDIQPDLFRNTGTPDIVYGSTIFKKSRAMVDALLRLHPNAHIGGTGIDLSIKLEDVGISGATKPFYGIYPDFTSSIGFTQRGCRLRCDFCVVPEKEGAVKQDSSVSEIWRGDPYPRDILLLDNDFFGQPKWRERVAEIRDGGFRVSLCQGINVRLINKGIAAALASMDTYNHKFSERQLYIAWDSMGDEDKVMRGISYLVDAGIRPRRIMVYMLVGFADGETHEDRDYRRRKLRERGVVPYPMPFTRTRELVGFQRWVVRAIDKYLPWDEFAAAGYDARNIKPEVEGQLRLGMGGS